VSPDPIRCLHVFSTFDTGGPQARTARIINALGPGFRHVVTAMDGRTGAAVWLRPEAQVEVVGLPVRKGRLFVARMARWLAAQRFDLVLTYNWGAVETVLAARLARARVIHAEDGFREDEALVQKRRRVIARRILLRGLPAVVVPSRTLQAVAQGSWRLAPESVVHIDNGIDTARFAPGSGAEVRGEFGIAPDAFVCGTVSLLRPVKNVGKLVRTFDRAAQETAHLVGPGGARGHGARASLARQDPLRRRAAGPGRLLPRAGRVRPLLAQRADADLRRRGDGRRTGDPRDRCRRRGRDGLAREPALRRPAGQ
jgi:glycosyltransferase involved in cell wall biosynthesis